MSRKKKRRSLGPILYDYESWPIVLQFVFVPAPIQKQSLIPRTILLIFMVYLTGSVFINGSEAWVVKYLHNLNLPVHEFGHPFFGLLGNDMLKSLGGTLAQMLMPFIFCLALWIKPRDLFGASIALWWVFENFIDTAPYIADSIVMQMTLTSGTTGAEMPYGFHDWNYILSETGLLMKCDTVASICSGIGYAGMAFCILWGAFSLFYYNYFQKPE